jgi:hypothetical protein
MNNTSELDPQPNSPEGSIRAASACTQAGYQPIDTRNALSGRDLRYVLTDYIGRGYRTVAQLVTKLAQDGYTVWGRASKIVSDALRWEIRNGRVKRIRRGLYAINTIPRTTLHRIRTRSQALFFVPHVVATRRNNPTTGRPKHTPPPDRHWREWHRAQLEPRWERPLLR